MNLKRLSYVVGAVVSATGIAMLAAAAAALIYQEYGDALGIGVASAVTVAVGAAGWRLVGTRGELSVREGFAAVALSWLAMAIFGTLPFLVTQEITDVSSAIFETTAGFTTTGASVIADPSSLSHGLLFWRALTQWLGGMGIIVLSVAILPLLGVGGVQLARAESPGPTPDRLTPRFRETAKRLWYVYLGLTAAEVLLLWAGDMTLFEAIAHSLTTMSTGGFSTEAGSAGAFSAYAQWVMIFFMFMAGVSFALHFRALYKPADYLKQTEFRLYGAIVAAAAVVMVIGTWEGGVEKVIREGVFTAVSIVTTTGYGTADFGQWATALQIIIVGLMFIGGMAGSTAGSVKVYRIGVLYRASRADLRRIIHPHGIFVTRFGKQEVSDELVESVQSFFLLYMFLFMTGTVLLGIIESGLGTGLDLVSATSAVASAIGNIGPGLGEVGPTETYAGVHDLSKWLLSGLMIVGRLEIFPVVLLLTRELWRR